MELINPVINRWILDARERPEAFWARAAEELPWLPHWDRVFEWEYPTFRWFVGGQTNLVLQRAGPPRRQRAGRETGADLLQRTWRRRELTYSRLLSEVEGIAASLRGMGIGKGDRLTVYMPTCPEAIMLMLATVRIGAIHSVVFAGFGENALADRVQASGSKLVFTADITYRRGKDVALKGIVDEAMASVDCVEHVVVLKRGDGAVEMHPGETCPGTTSSAAVKARAGSSSRWTRTSPPSSSLRLAPRPSRNSRCTRTVATRCTSPRWRAGASGSSRTTCGGPAPISAGSSGTATSSTRR